MTKAFRFFISLLSFAIFSMAVMGLWHADWRGAIQSASQLEVASLSMATALIVASFFIFALYDYLAWIWHGETAISFWAILKTSFVSTCAAMNVGMSVLSGGAVRLKMYGDQGFELKAITIVYLRIMILFGVGWLIWLGIGLGLSNRFLSEQLGLPSLVFRILGFGSLLGAIVYLTVCYKGLAFRIGDTQLAAPSLSFAILHLLVSASDILTSAGVFYVLLQYESVSFLNSVPIFMLANTAGIASQIPGGLGAFEWTALELSSRLASDGQILAGLLVFRLSFFWIPLLAALPLALHQFRPKS